VLIRGLEKWYLDRLINFSRGMELAGEKPPLESESGAISGGGARFRANPLHPAELSTPSDLGGTYSWKTELSAAEVVFCRTIGFESHKSVARTVKISTLP